MRSIFARHPVLVSALLLFTAIALFFTGRFTYRVVYWSTHQNVAIAPWMTVGYVGHSWGLDPRAIDAAAGLPPPRQGHPLTLREIAAERGVPVEKVIAEVEAAVARLKAGETGSGRE